MDSIDVEVAPGVSLKVRRWPGSHRVKPFVLVHGLSSNARLWDAVARNLLAAGHSVYAVDLRSHGESSATDEGHDTATAADDVARVIAAVNAAPALVAGQSWGGNVVARLAARHPSAVAALALVDGGWLDLSEEFDTWEQCEAALRPPDIDGSPVTAVHAHLRSAHPDWSAEAIAATVANLRTRADGRVERRLPIPAHMRIVRSMWDDPPWRDLDRVTVPVLLLPAIPGEPAAASRRRMLVEKAAGLTRTARVREYVGGDHDLHAQQPEALAADLLSLAGGQ